MIKPGAVRITPLLFAAVLAACAKDAPMAPGRIATQLYFTGAPRLATAGSPIVVAVSIVDSGGIIVHSASDSVTLAIGANAGGVALVGTTTVAAVDGVAIFSSIMLSQQAVGVTLVASAEGLTGATVGPISVNAAPPPGNFQGLSSGSSTCGITPPGAVYCWGGNAFGELGASSAASFSAVPVAIPGGHQFTKIAAGRLNACAIAVDGATYCWGFNPNTGLAQPVGGGQTFVSLTQGGPVTCGLTPAGAAYCWGNAPGPAVPLGDGTANKSASPVLVAGGLTFASISSSGPTCAVTISHDAYCWGSGLTGLLGDDTTSTSLVPRLIPAGLSFASISVGGQHVCAVTVAGTAYCWGMNSFGQLGDSTATNESHPVPVSGGHIFSSISAGQATTCGITVTGVAYCWGSNQNGQIGDGTRTNRSVPVGVAGGLFTGSLRFASISAGSPGTAFNPSGFTCGVTTDGATYCWGLNTYGELGNSTTNDSSLPTRITGGLHFAAEQRNR